jgi:cobalt/nickel transport system ATP-binding protein
MNVTPIIELHQIGFCYPDGWKALCNVSLSLNKGEKVVILGRNGAGKSTLFLVLNGIYKPGTGDYMFYGAPVTWKKNEIAELRKKIGVVFQEPDNQLFAPSVYEELSFGPMNLKLPNEEVKQRVEMAMEQFGIRSLSHKPPHLLSFGQKKKVAIASVVTMKPEILVLDEVFSGLDPENCRVLIKILDELHSTGMTIVLSSHDIDLAYQWADRIIIMDKGGVLQTGKPEEIFSEGELPARYGRKLPFVLEIYNHIAHKLPGSNIPRDMESLKQLIDTIL